MKFRISQSHDHIKNRPVFCVLGTDNEYRGGWHGTKHAACRELEALGEEEETPIYGWSHADTDLWENQYKAVLVQDGEVRRLFVFDFRGGLVTGILNYGSPRFYSAVPAAVFVLRLGASALKCHEEILAEVGLGIDRNEFVRSHLESLWLMLPNGVAIDETHCFRIQDWALT